MSPLLIALFAFAGSVAAAVAGTLWMAGKHERPEARVRARLGALRRDGSSPISGAEPLLKQERAGATAWPDRLLDGSPVFAHVEDLVRRSEFRFAAGTVLAASAGLGLLMPFLLGGLGVLPPIAILFGGLSSLLPYAYLRRRVNQRNRRFLQQMPEGLDTISQGLQAGLGLGHAQVFLAEEAAEPMRGEFSVFLQEMNLGLPLREAVANFAKRMPLHEVRLFSTALVVQREVGGSLAEVLVRLGDVIRDRFRIEQEIRSLTAQNRMTAYVVCALPLVLTGLMFLLNPKFMEEISSHPIGVMMLTMAAISWTMGAFVFWRMLKIHV